MINGLVSKHVVSTSRTPGHTKHFQHIHITKEIRLMDCPGLGTFGKKISNIFFFKKNCSFYQCFLLLISPRHFK